MGGAADGGVARCEGVGAVKGIRVYPRGDGWLDPHEMAKPGAYGRPDVEKVLAGRAAAGYPVAGDHPWTWWQMTCPDGHGGTLDPKIHQVIEHEDGTITISPSIDMSQRIPGAYHGWLRRGEWS